MICKQCGYDIPEGDANCPVCGWTVTENTEDVQANVEQYVEEEALSDGSDDQLMEDAEKLQVGEADFFDEEQPSQNAELVSAPKVSSKKWIGLTVAAVIVLALAAVGVFARPQLMKLFLSPKTYYTLLEARNIKQLQKSLSVVPQTAATTDKLGQYCTVTLDSSGIPNLSSATLQAINALQLNFINETDKTKGVSNAAFDLSYRAEKLIEASVHVNGDKTGLQLPQINQNYYTLGSGSTKQEDDSIYGYIQGVTGLGKSDIDSILDRYLRKVYLDNIPDKNVAYLSNAKLEGKSYNAIQLTFDSQTLKNMTDDLRSSLKNDQQLKKALKTAYEKNQTLFTALSGEPVLGGTSAVPQIKTFEQAYDQWIKSISFDQAKYVNQSVRMTLYFNQQERLVARQIATYKNEKQVSNLMYQNTTEGHTQTISLAIEVENKQILDLQYKQETQKKQVTHTLTIASGGVNIFGGELTYTANQDKYDGSMNGAMRINGVVIKLSGTFSLELVDGLAGKIVTGDSTIEADVQNQKYTIQYSSTQGDTPNQYNTNLKFNMESNQSGSASMGFGLNFQYTEKKLSHVDPVTMTDKNSQPISKLLTDQKALETLEMNIYAQLVKTKLGDALGLYGDMSGVEAN